MCARARNHASINWSLSLWTSRVCCVVFFGDLFFYKGRESSIRYCSITVIDHHRFRKVQKYTADVWFHPEKNTHTRSFKHDFVHTALPLHDAAAALTALKRFIFCFSCMHTCFNESSERHWGVCFFLARSEPKTTHTRNTDEGLTWQLVVLADTALRSLMLCRWRTISFIRPKAQVICVASWGGDPAKRVYLVGRQRKRAQSPSSPEGLGQKWYKRLPQCRQGLSNWTREEDHNKYFWGSGSVGHSRHSRDYARRIDRKCEENGFEGFIFDGIMFKSRNRFSGASPIYLLKIWNTCCATKMWF